MIINYIELRFNPPYDDVLPRMGFSSKKLMDFCVSVELAAINSKILFPAVYVKLGVSTICLSNYTHGFWYKKLDQLTDTPTVSIRASMVLEL